MIGAVKVIVSAIALTAMVPAARAGHASRWSVGPMQSVQVFSARPKQPPAPKWCLCARVCQASRDPGYAARIPQGQSLAVCPQLHDEIVYDNRATCGCNRAEPVPGSPNH